MEKSRSKRNYYYDHQDYDSESMGRTRPRYNNHYASNNYRHRGTAIRPSKPQDQPLMVTTTYRILCHDAKAGGVIGKSGSIIKSIRQHTGAWINVHELVPGDEERIIEISDTRRRDPEGRMSSFSPAQEALFLIHERILESEMSPGFNGMGYGAEDEEDDYGEVRGGAGGGSTRVATRLVVSRMHVGCLLGKGGKIIEQMRMETKTQIRVLPRDHNLPSCITMSEEIVQIVGDANGVKKAIAIISSRLRESQHRDRSHFHGRLHSPERMFPPDDDYVPHTARRLSMDGRPFRPRISASNTRSNDYLNRHSSFSVEHGATPVNDNMMPFYGEDLVFRILCPIEKVDSVIGESDGIIELLRNEVGVDIKVSSPMTGSNEQILIISSDEGPDDELFPAQEALLHIQTRIVDLVPDKDNIVTTRLLVHSSDIGCLEGRDGSLLEMKRLTGANVQIVPREELPMFVSGADELVQIIGDIQAARDALVELTSRLRSYICKEPYQKDASPPISAPNTMVSLGLEESSSNNNAAAREVHSGNDSFSTAYQNVQPFATAQLLKETGGSSNETGTQNENDRREDLPSGLNRSMTSLQYISFDIPIRIPVPLVTRSTLEVVIPEPAVPQLITKSKNKLAQISELSGANVTLVEDRPDITQKIIQISGTPEQAERAQSLLQGFILSMQEDGP